MFFLTSAYCIFGGKMNSSKAILTKLFLDIENSPVAFMPADKVYRYAKKVLGLKTIQRREVVEF